MYDGYSYQPLLLSKNQLTGFSHLHDFEPTATNHSIPHYGIFSNLYFRYAIGAEHSASVAYTDFKKNHGPPYKHWPQEFDPLEHNEYLASKGVEASEVRHPAAQARVEGKAEAPATD